jgi:decaprenyl-phosphate phosphoribosyltransferase
MRPRQWLKNVLVFGAPAAAGVLTHASAFGRAAEAFAAFCLAASGTYCVNDVLDREKDRLHPEKRNRPIAAGTVSVRAALTTATVLFAGALAVSLAAGRPKLTLVLGVYVVVTLAYSAFLKNQPILELGALASGFVLRAIAGGVAVPVALSNWFLIVACFGSLFVVTGKREAELGLLGEDGSAHRSALGAYTPSFLRYIRSVASGVLMTGYCLWAFENPGLRHDAHPGGAVIWFQLSIAPFVFGVLRYALLIDSGQGGAPEDVFLRDRTLQILGLCMATLFAIGVYH